MSFRFDEMHEALGCWYLAYADKDWLCMVWRANALAGWTIRYRVRYYDPREPEAWSGTDRKVWYEAEAPVDRPRQRVLDDMRRLQALLREQWPQPTTMADEVVVEGDGLALAQAMRGRPWVHAKVDEEVREWDEHYAAHLLPAQRRRAVRLQGKRKGRR